MNVPKIVPVNLAVSLKEAGKAHSHIQELIAKHAAEAAQQRQAAHDRLAAENQLAINK